MNRPAFALRSDRHALGALYGAFAVVVVATVVVGLLMAEASRPNRSQASSLDGKLSDLFLQTILSSTEGRGSWSVQDAIADLCIALPCLEGSHVRPFLANNITRIAGPLAHSLERRWSFSLARGSTEVFEAGDLLAGSPAVASRVDIFHEPSGDYLTVTLRLGPW